MGILGMPLAAALAQEDRKSKLRTHYPSLIARMHESTADNKALQQKDVPLDVAERRIIRQEVYELDGMSTEPYLVADYGYYNEYMGQQFHPHFMRGFPMDIAVATNDDVFWDPNMYYNSMSLNFFAPAQNLHVPVHFDTVRLYLGGDLFSWANTSRDGVNDRINAVQKFEGYWGPTPIYSSTEKFFTNNRTTQIDYKSGYSPIALELQQRRLISYGNNNRIATDTVQFFAGGPTVQEQITFDYFYDSNHRLEKVRMNNGPDSMVLNVFYYPNGQLQKTEAYVYNTGVIEESQLDSLGYAPNGFVGLRFGAYTDHMSQYTETELIELIYDGMKLDSIKLYFGDEFDLDEGGIGKYFYSVDNNPDSLLVYYDYSATPEEKVLFHYEPFTSVSVKKVTRNDHFSVYPNPVSSSLHIQNKVALKNKMATITLIDMRGSKVWSGTMQLPHGESCIELPAQLAAGSYILTIEADNSIYSQHIIKQ